MKNSHWRFLPLLVVLIILTIALGVAAPGAYPEGDTAMVRTGLTVVGTLWTVALGLILWTRQQALAMGVVFSAAGLFMLGAVPLALIEFAVDTWTPTFKALASLEALLAMVTGGTAAYNARREFKPFVAGIGAALLLLVVVGPVSSGFFQQRLETLQQTRDTDRTNEVRATSRVFALTSCLLRRAADTGGNAFPGALTELAGSPGCSSADLSEVLAGYRLNYIPNANGISGFQLVAEPEDATGDAGVVVADARGLLFVIRPKAGANENRALGAYLHWKERGLGPVYGMQRIIGEIMEAGRLTAPPSSLAPYTADSSTRVGRWLNVTLAEQSVYKVEYIHAPEGDAGTFAVRSTCQRYGELCIRSYYRGPDGRIHGIGLPRAATAEDPVIDAREDADGDVSGLVGWGGR